METKNTSKTSSLVNEKFICFKCDFKCSKKGDWTRHLTTTKHKNNYNVTVGDEELHKNTSPYTCMNCLKNYISRNGLWLHKKKCKSIKESKPQITDVISINISESDTNANTSISVSKASVSEASVSESSASVSKASASISEAIVSVSASEAIVSVSASEASANASVGDATTIINSLINENNDFKLLIMEMLKSNNELQTQIIEVCKNTNQQKNNNNTTINNNNSHNKTFNLQVFLNEECKDAMNLSEFINSLQVQLSDLENMSSLGYTEGISKIILNEMSGIDQNKRPVHCTDIKRDTLYVKDEDKWEKEQPEFPKLKQAIRRVEQKNFGLMGEWQAEHPDYKDSTTHENTEFLKLVSQTMNGTPENMYRVIKRIAKEVVIDK